MKYQHTFQRQDLLRNRILNESVVVKKHTIRRLVSPQRPRHVPVHPPRQARAKSDPFITGLRWRQRVDSQLPSSGVAGDRENLREALARAGIRCEGLERLPDEGSAPRWDHGRPVNVRFVGDDYASVRV